jgi:hypothetical protein
MNAKTSPINIVHRRFSTNWYPSSRIVSRHCRNSTRRLLLLESYPQNMYCMLDICIYLSPPGHFGDFFTRSKIYGITIIILHYHRVFASTASKNNFIIKSEVHSKNLKIDLGSPASLGLSG